MKNVQKRTLFLRKVGWLRKISTKNCKKAVTFIKNHGNGGAFRKIAMKSAKKERKFALFCTKFSAPEYGARRYRSSPRSLGKFETNLHPYARVCPPLRGGMPSESGDILTYHTG